jgi:hypothetical protein
MDASELRQTLYKNDAQRHDLMQLRLIVHAGTAIFH